MHRDCEESRTISLFCPHFSFKCEIQIHGKTNETWEGTGRVPFVDTSRRSCPAASHSDFGKGGKQREKNNNFLQCGKENELSKGTVKVNVRRGIIYSTFAGALGRRGRIKRLRALWRKPSKRLTVK